MLSSLLLPPPSAPAPPIRPRLIRSHHARSLATTSAISVSSYSPPGRPRLLHAVHQSLPHLSNPNPLHGQRPPIPHGSSTKRSGPRPPSATSSPLTSGPGLWESLKAAVAVIPTPILLGIATAVVVSTALQLFSSPGPGARERARVDAPPPPPPPAPIQLGAITEDELRQYDGSDPSKPLLMAIKGEIYDVSSSRLFYGPGGPYALFAGKDASRALAKMSFDEKDLTGDISNLGPFELSALQDWEFKFRSKYVIVGTIKKPSTLVEDALPASEAAAMEGRNGSMMMGDVSDANEAAVSQDDVTLDEGSKPSNDVVQAIGAGGFKNPT